MWRRVSWRYRKHFRFFIFIEHHSRHFFRYANSAEHLLFHRFKIDPFDFERRFTVFDFTFFINQLVDELNEENKDREKNDGDKLLKILRIMKNMLNRIEI